MGGFEDAVAEFLAGAGMDAAASAPASGGSVELEIESVGRLGLESDGERAFVTLARPYPPHAEDTARKLLDRCHWRENHPWPVAAGALGREWISVTARIPLAAFDRVALERAVAYLSSLLDAAA